MAALNFKYGAFSKLPETQVPGTVYITADEQAMYVDLPAVTTAEGDTIEARRARIGQIIVKDSARVTPPPYSKDAFYYFIEENALLRWDGSAWTQLNSTSQIDKDISDLKNSVSSLTGTVGDHTTAINLLNGNASTVGSVAYAVAQETTRASAAEKANSDAIKVVEGNVSTNAANIQTNTTNIASVTGRVDDLETRMGTAEGNISTNTGNITKNTNAITKLNGDASTEGSVAYAVAQETTRATGKENELSGSINSLSGNLGDLTTRVTTAETNISTNTGNISTNTSAIATLNGDENVAGSVAAKIKVEADRAKKAESDLSESINEVSGDLSDLTTRVGTAENTISTHTTNIGNNTTNIGKNTDAIALLNGNNTTSGSVAYAVKQEADRAVEEENRLAGLIEDNNTAIETLNGADTVSGSVAYAVKQEADRAKGIENGLQSQITTIVDGTSGITLKTLNTAIQDAVSVNGTQTTNINSLTGRVGDLETNSATKTELANQKTTLEKYVNDTLAAADAMTFKNGIASYSELPVTGVKGGDTYVLTANDGIYTAGDMIIAKEDQGADDLTYGGDWIHVKTGYIESHNDTFVVEGETNDVQLVLDHYAGTDSVVNFKPESGSMITVSHEVTDNSQSIVIGMEWGTF